MISEKLSQSKLGKAILGGFLSLVMVFSGVMPGLMGGVNVYADEDATEVVVDENANESADESSDETTNEASDETGAENVITGELEAEINSSEGAKSCKDSLGAVGWLVCPATGTIAKAVDWLYDKIEEILVINPVEMRDGAPIYEIWKYFRGVTNVIFVIFLLVVIYSQITGVGISNYGIKKVLPKMIVVAVLINLSFIICSLAVDLSNIVGNSLRGVFEGIETSVLSGTDFAAGMTVSMSQMYAALGAGGTVAIGAGVVAFEAGAIWMLIPTVLGAIVAVAVGLITIAMRQAVVAILIMISPLAIVAYMLPNTDKWFQQWKQLLIRMLVFYPAFSLLFGASSLAGFAIIASASSGFGIVLGVAVQIFPLFFAWKMMKMSGTFLETVNTKLRSLADRPLATNRAWAESHRAATLNKNMAAKDVYTPSLYLRQYLENRRIARELETKEDAELVAKRGAAYHAGLNYRYNRRGELLGVSRRGEETAEKIGRGLKYDQIALRDKNNLNKGLSTIEAMSAKGSAQRARLEAIDAEIVRNADDLKFEQARTEKIEYDNAYGFHKRAEDAINAHEDLKHAGLVDENGNIIYKTHNIKDRTAAEARFASMREIMDGNIVDTHYTAAYAAHAYDTQAKTIMTKFQKYFELTPPTKDVMYRLQEFSEYEEALKQWTEAQRDGKKIGSVDRIRAVNNIDAIISGLRVLNQRGDTNLVKDIMDDIMDEEYGGLELGTHASQALASFLMFEVKDSDPWMRRFGKYLNMETAHLYDKNKRKKETVDYAEYVKGYYYDPDSDEKQYPKKAMRELMEGTSLDGIERTAVDNYIDSVMDAYSKTGKDEKGREYKYIPDEDYAEFENKLSEVNNATAPQLISAMRKTLSGSEALVSMVKDVTGYEKHQKDDGTYELRSIFDSDKIKDRFGDNLGSYKKYRRKWAQTYLKGLLPSQVLSMRTDELLAFEQLLPEWYQNDHEEEHKELKKLIAERYSDDLNTEQRAALLNKVESREMFRECLDMGVLEQISRTNMRRGVLDSKPMLRDFLGLDGDDGSKKRGLSKYIDEKKGIESSIEKMPEMEAKDKEAEAEAERIARELEEIYRQRRESIKQKVGAKTDEEASHGPFTESDLASYKAGLEEIYRSLTNKNDHETYFEETAEYVKANVPVIFEAYNRFREINQDSSVAELMEELGQLIDGLPR